VATAVAKRRGRPAAVPGRAAAPTRELILDAAERLFAARGVDGVAVRDLAAEMGITASSLYNHFPSKQALYDAVIERGLGPIVEIVTAAWQGDLAPIHVQGTIEALTAHLARHPHLAPLMQRALLEESGSVQALIEHRIAILYRGGMAVIRKAARNAGWGPEEVPHLGVALFGMIFAHFTNAAGLQRIPGWSNAPLSEQTLAVQRRFLQRAILRLLGPRPPKPRAKRGRPPHG